ncbi:hypothetical protein D1816_16175 [Aquimarina sp. AD10]|uniref:hypothetical protein n=1 Tax=Aquimarina sp. AD10 TaxID=1714849 RepID=UPI000E544B2C|nr:hypothetical protein [Aquimarina sp. AD10]AXT61827.1 hypothetical protein D1816_16175 [Aquimarina sp. AD10]
MNFSIKYYLLLALGIVICSCSDDSENDSFILSGKIMTNNEPVSNVTVSVDGFQNFTVTTDVNGDFEIKNISSGEKNVKISKNFSSQLGESFSEKNFNVDIQGNTNLDNITLPNPVYIKITDKSTSSISLEWNTSNDSNFREYKLYRDTTPGLDETTGELIFVSTDKSTNTFEDKYLSASRNYYYRVYVMDNLGLLGGSNLASGKTDTIDLIVNGDFETNGIEFWDYDRIHCGAYYEFELKTDTGYNSSNSIEIDRIIGTGPGICVIGLDQIGQIEPYSVSAGQEIELSFYYKLEGGLANFRLGIWAEGYPGGMTLISNSGSLIEANDWVYFSKVFRTSSLYDNDNVFPMYLTLGWELPTVNSKLSLDNLKLVGV